MKIVINTDNAEVKVKKTWKDRSKSPNTIHTEMSAAIAYLLAERAISEFEDFYLDDFKTNWIDFVAEEAKGMVAKIGEMAKVEMTTKEGSE